SGSASRKLSSVASENTTPKPKVSSGRLRSSTVISCAGSVFFMRIAKYNPAGPPPTETIFTRSFYRTSPVRNVHVHRRLSREAAGAAARRLTRFAARLAQRARHRPLRPRTVRLAALTQRARPTPASLHSRGEEPPRHLEAVASQARLAERDQREEPAEPRVEG